MPLTLVFDFIWFMTLITIALSLTLDEDRQTVILTIEDKAPLQFHQVCAWKRATFVFGLLF